MMMSLGLFVFKLSTLPYQTTNHQVNYTWAENARFGQRADESQAAMFGDLMAQAEGLYNKASSAIGNFITGG